MHSEIGHDLLTFSDLFNLRWQDYTTTGWTLLLAPEKMVTVRENSVNVGGSQEFHCVIMAEFLAALAGALHT